MKMKNELRRKILVVDDDELNATALAKRLDRRGMDVIVLTGFENVLNTIKEHRVELILLDIIMPGKDGVTLLREIRNLYPSHQLPIIMATAIDDNVDIVESFKLGANDYITKPINIDVAVARMRAHMGQADLYRESIQKKQLEAVHALVTTYHHEINNPLAVALACVSGNLQNDQVSQKRLEASLWRISDIIKKIKHVSESHDIEYQTYVGEAKMIKFKK